jgi:hypothetical protein
MFKKTFLLLLSSIFANCCFSQNKDSLYVFVGERISVNQFIPGDTIISRNKDSSVTKRIYMDEAFKAKYKVLKNVFHQLNQDTVEFEAYDHYGKPPFANYKYVLLFITKSNGKLYHEKYMYFEVYKTSDGKWASACDPDCTRFNEDYEKVKSIAMDIQFEKSVDFKLAKISSQNVELYYNAPNFRIERDKAIPIKGVYAEDLFEIAAEHILKNRGYFK